MLWLHKSQYLNKDTKKRKMSLKLNESYLNILSVKIKEEDIFNSRPLKIGNLGENSQLWYWRYIYLKSKIYLSKYIELKSSSENKSEKAIKNS